MARYERGVSLMWFAIGLLAIGVIAMARVKPVTAAVATVASVSGRTRLPSALETLHACMRHGRAVPHALVEACMREAYESGDAVLLRRLHATFPGERIASQMQSKPEHAQEPVEVRSPEIVVGKNSPIYGVSNEE